MENRFFDEIHGNFGFGCMRLPMKDSAVDLEQMTEMVDTFLNQGFNYFDTAHGYLGGASETALRETLVRRYPRNRYILTNKLTTFYFQRESDIRPLFQSQLEACGVEYFDFYLMHAQDGAIFEKFKRCHAYETALELKAEGKIRHFGISFHDKAPVLERILTEYPQVEAVQIQLNYLDYEDATVESRKVYEVCEKHHKPVIVMEPVKGGSLVRLPEEAQSVLDTLQEDAAAKKSNASYALRFAASLPNVCVVLSGMSDMAQMRDNTGTMKAFTPLSETERSAVEQVRDVFRGMHMIPCTTCHYCTKGCPKQIPIPEIFTAMNQRLGSGQLAESVESYRAATAAGGKASDCVACRQCEKACPQHIPIVARLKECAVALEG